MDDDDDETSDRGQDARSSSSSRARQRDLAAAPGRARRRGGAPAPRRRPPDPDRTSLIKRLAGSSAGSPQHPIGADGRMALSDHLRELRARLLRSALVVVVVAFVVALFFYDQLARPDPGALRRRRRPAARARSRPRSSSTTSPARCCSSSSCAASSAVIGSSPYWLYQIWAFILPGLHATERKWSRIFAAIAGPLFFAGVALGYFDPAQGDRGPDRVHARRRHQPRRLRRLLLLHHPDAARLRHRLRDPAVRDHAQPGRRRLRQGARPLPTLDRHRHLRLRRRGHAVDRPVLDAVPRGPDAGPVRRSPRSSRGSSTAPAAGNDADAGLGDDEVSAL